MRHILQTRVDDCGAAACVAMLMAFERAFDAEEVYEWRGPGCRGSVEIALALFPQGIHALPLSDPDDCGFAFAERHVNAHGIAMVLVGRKRWVLLNGCEVLDPAHGHCYTRYQDVLSDADEIILFGPNCPGRR